ncbi:MAG: efflux RND transporter periplasmic adaptor subunit [Treponema sp.]|jgi:multidrug efflux pump subunit AcrA (membrane-fusion protein)|nr:efflux RND transporter periplasmic adaptor subunit [Treponema sp.]
MKMSIKETRVKKRRPEKTRRLRGGSAVLAGMCALLLFSGCERIKEAYGKLSGAPAAGAPVEAPIFAVNTTPAVQGQIRDYIALSGDIVAGSTVDTYSDAAGKVTQVYVTVGDRINRGAPIAAVDPSKPGMNYVPGIARAPISGIVTSLPAQVGMTISQTMPLARIAGGSALEIELYVAERFISKIALRQPCEITLDAWPGETFRGSVTEIAPTVDPASRTMEVKVNVENPGSKLKAGMFAKVRLITEEKENIVKIPSSAMIQRFGEIYVFIVEADGADSKNGIARRRIITPGILIDNILEVQAGLGSGEEVIIRGQSLLEDGARVNIIERVQSLAAN